ncbi:unnamed protein product [Cladocopium goreaui]|uniref:Zeta toxin domain-containing protein n=1 Tax=Cladocopium goreaui TaxID=2562237 RepID=A0A9P1DTL5_9DINO|nr:unnamed protein product [Cladocopium goreaui]
MSASAFLAAVKGRLMEWGKVEQYHRFVVALSGTVDVKLAVKILRGHEDLLQIFQRKFAPQADLRSTKREIKEQEEQEEQQAARARRRVAPVAPRPPPFPPPRAEMAQPVGAGEEEDLPRPPAFPPGHESEEVGHENVPRNHGHFGYLWPWGTPKVQLLFDRGAESDTERVAVSRYALKVVSKPRFPRELYILRGAPGIGKSDFAQERLAELRRLEPSEESAARLSHICAASDFLSADYQGEEYQFEKAMKNNEMRALLSMEAGIHPVFIDCPNLRLWEMKPYVLLAERLGYVIHVIEPWEICAKHDDLPFLCSLHDDDEQRAPATLLQAMLRRFQPLPAAAEPTEAIRRASSSGARHFLR